MSVIWITGGKGFLGRHLARLLATRGNSVLGIGHGLWPAESARTYGFKAWVNGEIESSNLSQLAAEAGVPSRIFHLAGGSSVGLSFQTPLEDFARTADTTARLLEWTRLNSIQTNVLCVSSAAVYGSEWKSAIPESASLRPYSPYGHHKAIMESIARSYAENFGLQIGIVRLFSVYGEELRKQLIWDICCKLSDAANATLTLGGTGDELRDWLHVSDAVLLLEKASECCSSEVPVWNGGTGIATNIRDIATACLSSYSSERRLEFTGVARKGDPQRLVAETKLAEKLGFAPSVVLEEGIRRTVEWFRRQRRGA